MGSAFLVQNKAVVVVPIVMYLIRRWGRSPLLAFAFAFMIPVGLWMLRNLLVRQSLSPLNTNGPINLWIGSNPDATTGGFMEPPALPPGVSGYLDATVWFWISQPEFSISLLLRRMARLLEPVYLYPPVAFPPGGPRCFMG